MRLPKLVLSLALLAGLGLTAVSSASATDRDCYSRRTYCGYRTVTVYVEKEICYRTRVIRYTSCGNPYYKWVTRHKTIEIPKKIRVRTCR